MGGTHVPFRRSPGSPAQAGIHLGKVLTASSPPGQGAFPGCNRGVICGLILRRKILFPEALQACAPGESCPVGSELGGPKALVQGLAVIPVNIESTGSVSARFQSPPGPLHWRRKPQLFSFGF